MLASRTLLSMLVLAITLPLPAFAADVCESSVQPAATLLFPYFEVDLADATGRTTLISINNAGEEPTVARVTLWTNAGLATISFDMVLDPRDVQSINLRNVLGGQVPLTSIDAELPECSDPLVIPEPPEEEVATWIAWHTGREDRLGNCRGVAGDEEDLAVGYITVDAMNRCTDYFTYPGDDGYFEDGGVGRASNANVLWGDLILIDNGGDAAQSVAAVHIRADAERFAGGTRTFYGFGADDRAPLPATYRGRFLAGQPAGTETSFQLWLDPVTLGLYPELGFECGESNLYSNPCAYLEAQAYDEAGDAIGEPFIENSPLVLRRLNIASNAGAGFIEMGLRELVACFIIPTGVEPRQAVMIPLLEAEGRFSAATAAVALDSTCDEP